MSLFCRRLRSAGIGAVVPIACLLPSVSLPRVDISAQEKKERKDGERIILWMDSSDPFVDRHIAVVSLHDKSIHRLTEQPKYGSQLGYSVVVSRDGKSVAYLADEYAPPEGGLVTWTLYVLSTDDVKGKGRSLGLDKVTHIDAWSHDGKQLIVSTQDDSQLLVDVKTKAVKKLPLPKAEPPKDSQGFSGHYVTDWSRDGASFLSILVYRDKSDKWHREMYIVNREGTVAKRLEHIPSGLLGKFSPDGKRILFLGEHKEDAKTYDQLFVSDVAGGKPVRVSQELNGMLFGHAWSPDGKRIVYVWDNREKDDAQETFLMLVDADGKNPQVLCSQKSRGRQCFYSPNWR